MKENRAWLPVCLSIVLLSVAAHSEPEADSAVDTPSLTNSMLAPVSVNELGSSRFTSPRLIKSGRINYPLQARRNRQEGWVELSMMVDREGKPFEIGVVDSTGDAVLEKAVLEAAKDYQFTPATLNGESVDAAYMFKAVFSIYDKAKGASAEFVQKYKAVIKAVQAGDKAAAEKIFGEMKIESLYEDAFFNLARFVYFRQWGDEQRQMRALRRAIAYENKSKFLPPAEYQAALSELFNLQLKTNDYAGALRTFANFTSENKSDLNDEKLVRNIVALRRDESAYSINGEIGKDATWFFELFKRNFSILLSQGELADVKLLCQSRFVLMKYKPNMDYSIPDDYGRCFMEIVGSPGAKFTLVQS